MKGNVIQCKQFVELSWFLCWVILNMSRNKSLKFKSFNLKMFQKIAHLLFISSFKNHLFQVI